MDKTKILQAIAQNKAKFIPSPTSLNIVEEKCNEQYFDSLTEKQTSLNIVEEKSGKLNRFKESLIQVGGDFFEISAKDEFDAFIDEHFPGAENFMKKDVREKYSQKCPTEKLAELKTIIIEGKFGIAENGAIWIDELNLSHRLIPFVCEELIICLNSEQIVEDMQQAYSKLKNNEAGFGVFISGPSKTADIEQNLVYGAHAAKKLIVILCNQ